MANTHYSYSEYIENTNNNDKKFTEFLSNNVKPYLINKIYSEINKLSTFRQLPNTIDTSYPLPNVYNISTSINDYKRVINTCEEVAKFMKERGFPYAVNSSETLQKFNTGANRDIQIRCIFKQVNT